MQLTKFLAYLVCLIPISSFALPSGLPLNQPLRVIFASSNGVAGNIGGLSGADIFVQSAAVNPGSVLAGQAVTALLSVVGTSAQSRFTDNGEPIYNTQGERVANSLAEMFAGDSTSLANAIAFDETGSANGGIVWTATKADNSLGETHCVSFSTNSNTENGSIGRANQLDGAWTEWGALNCVNLASVYGLTHALIIPPQDDLFEDGFESN